MAIQYKFVELSVVTDETIEDAVNEWVGHGWQLEGIRFVTTEHSKRPSMAYVSFTREATQRSADTAAPRPPRPLVPPDSEDQPFVITAKHPSDVE
jgi:hypothetical protein